METLNNAEHFMVIRDYRTAAALFTAALNQCLGVSAPTELAATLLCKRAECLLRLVSIFFADSRNLKQLSFKPTLDQYLLVILKITYIFRIMCNMFCETVEQVSIIFANW